MDFITHFALGTLFGFAVAGVLAVYHLLTRRGK